MSPSDRLTSLRQAHLGLCLCAGQLEAADDAAPDRPVRRRPGARRRRLPAPRLLRLQRPLRAHHDRPLRQLLPQGVRAAEEITQGAVMTTRRTDVGITDVVYYHRRAETGSRMVDTATN